MSVLPCTILIIDNDFADRKTYCQYLSLETANDYRIFEAASAVEAWEYLRSIQVDLIVVDYLLPDLDGLKFIAQLKAKTKKMPSMIMLTGFGNEAIAVEAMKAGFSDYLVKSTLTSEVLITAVNKALQKDYLQTLLNKSHKQQQLIAEIALRIRKSLDLQQILDTAVREVQILLDCDRVIIYQFEPDMIGKVVAESVKPGWRKSLGEKINDTCFRDQGAGKYTRGETFAVDNIYQSQLSECHINLLEQFQVKANAVVPILLTSSYLPCDKGTLWGLLITHQCITSRNWQSDEIELLDKLSVQLAIAIQQAELLGSLQQELDNRQKLEAQVKRLAQVLEASEDYIGLATVEGEVIWNNPRLQQLVNCHQNINLAKFSIADYHPSWALKLIKETGLPTALTQGNWLGETALLRGDGEEIPVSQLILAHKSADGKIEYISLAMRDLSQQKQAEKSLKARAIELEWLNRELTKITSLLKERNRELDSFAYVTSHDLKAPLRAIANLATWLSEDLAGQIPEENQQQLALMQSRVKRMDGLIQGLLEYSRVGRKKNRAKIVDVANLLTEVIDSISPPSEFKILVAESMPVINTDALLLEQVFSNLISNAIKYHHSNSGTITIEVEDLGECYQFAIADDGPGISPIYHEKIFEIFQTLHARDEIESTGIGLSIVKKIVEGQGGSLMVKSDLGQGATFYFTWQKDVVSMGLSENTVNLLFQ